MNDGKASTYKLALLRTLVRIAEGASGLVRNTAEGDARVPLGLVALYWVRGFKPLIQADFRQTPRANTNAGLGFVKEPFRALDASPYDLHVGKQFSGATGRALRFALRDAAQTIKQMPANYITYPGSTEQIFCATYGKMPSIDNYSLDATFLWRYGELQVPAQVWHSLSHFAVWIEPILIGEWIAMMRSYDGDRAAAYERYLHALRWLDPEHDTSVVRRIVKSLQERDTPVRCVWTNRPLSKAFAIDHCIPFSRWPCNDLWNLLPATSGSNTSKGDRLPSAAALRDASARIIQWWDAAYLVDSRYRDRFVIETGAALPFVEDASEPAQVFDALALLRSNIRRDQQLPEWPV